MVKLPAGARVRTNNAHNWKNQRLDGTFKKSKRGKYNANGRRIDGIFFASKAEADRYEQLLELVKLGRIRDLELQPRYPLRVNNLLVCTYIADFRYKKILGGMAFKLLVEDVKGMLTDEYKLKRKLMAAVMPEVEVTEIKLPKRGTVARLRYLTADEVGTIPPMENENESNG